MTDTTQPLMDCPDSTPVGNELRAVGEPSIRPPIIEVRRPPFGLRNVEYLSGLNELQVQSLLVAIGQVLPIRRNRTLDYGVFAGICR